MNVSNNQVPIQACGNDAYGNVIGGQVPVEGNALVGSLLSPGFGHHGQGRQQPRLQDEQQRDQPARRTRAAW